MNLPKGNMEYVNYLGRLVPRKGFRVYVYDKDGHKRLVEDYDTYCHLVNSGDYYARVCDIPQLQKQKRGRPKKASSATVKGG